MLRYRNCPIYWAAALKSDLKRPDVEDVMGMIQNLRKSHAHALAHAHIECW